MARVQNGLHVSGKAHGLLRVFRNGGGGWVGGWQGYGERDGLTGGRFGGSRAGRSVEGVRGVRGL